MNPQVSKDLRITLPPFLLTIVPALLMAGIIRDLPWAIQCLFSFGLVWTAAATFGVELSSAAFSNLLVQPIPRQKIWQTKISLLFILFLLATFAFVIALGNKADHYKHIYIFILLALTTVPTWTLICRSGFSGAIMAVAMPFFIGVLSVLLHRVLGSPMTWPMFNNIVLSVYAIAFLILGEQLARKFELVSNFDKDISIPLRNPFSWGISRNSFLALIQKEVSLHRPTHLGAFIMVSLLTCLGGYYSYYRFTYGPSEWIQSWPEASLALLTVGLLWLLPNLIGIFSITEEIQSNSQSFVWNLAISQRAQWFVKIIAALGLAYTFSLILPLGVLSLLNSIWPGLQLPDFLRFFAPNFFNVTLVFVFMAAGFFIGALGRKGNKAIALAVGFWIGILLFTTYLQTIDLKSLTFILRELPFNWVSLAIVLQIAVAILGLLLSARAFKSEPSIFRGVLYLVAIFASEGLVALVWNVAERSRHHW